MRPSRKSFFVAAMILLFNSGGLYAQGNSNPGVLPIDSSAYGQTYGEWASAWWQWAIGIPLASNPIVDATGEFGHINQNGPVWFLAGTFGSTAERTVTVPDGKALFFPLINSIWWAPDDMPVAEFIVETFLELNPDDLTDEEVLELTALFQVTFETLELSCTVDGVELTNLDQHLIVSPEFQMTDTDLADDLGISVSQPNATITAGYWVMLTPLTPGEHTVQFSVNGHNNPLTGDFNVDVKYNITVE